MYKSKKQLGQNFLINLKVLPEIIEAAEIKVGDVVVEVGPGFGILTKALLTAGAKVYAIEKDFELIAGLTKKFGNNKSLKLVHQDALWFDETTLKKYKVVSNLPFNVASPIIRKFLESSNPPELMVVMVQKEVAEKIVAKPGNSERGVLTIATEFYSQPEIITEVSKSSFRPQPKVDAAIIKLKTQNAKLKSKESRAFFRIVKAGFAAKRKQVHNSLSATLRLPRDVILEYLKKANIEPTLRAEDLTLEQWIKLYQIIKKTAPEGAAKME